MLCVSVPCDKSLCGWSGLPCGWGYSYCGRGKHPVAVVVCPVARVMQNCVAQVTSKSTGIGSLVDCPFACRIVADHSLMSGVMHSLAGIMERKADCVQSVACLFTIHAPVWKFQHYTCQSMCTFSGTGLHMKHL